MHRGNIFVARGIPFAFTQRKSIFYNIADIIQRILILLLIYIRMLSPEDICYSWL